MNTFPDTLKSWRKTRRFSQLDLALEAQVSSRHISFLETGRARPSRDMIGRLSDVLQLPLAARNQMLTHAGFAAQYSARDWDDADMAPVRLAIDHMLIQHAPYPAMALDQVWTIHKMNAPARALFAALKVSDGDSLLDLMTSDRLPPLIENWPDVAHHAAQRLRTESVAQGGIPALDQTAAYLAQVPGQTNTTRAPVVPTIYRMGEARLSMFATIAQFGTPEDLALNELKIELYFPADDTSRHILENLTG